MEILKKAQTRIFEKWFEDLADNIKDRVSGYIDRALCGNFSITSPVGSGINNIKIDFQKGYRIYYTVINNNTILLLHAGGDKKSQNKDIALAKVIKANLKSRGII